MKMKSMSVPTGLSRPATPNRLGYLRYALAFAAVVIAPAVWAAIPDAPFCQNMTQNFPEEPNSLKCVPIPQPSLDAEGTQPISPRIVRSGASAQSALVALGKALFWDQQVGSDGVACASCHYKAGADDRIKNQIDPGLRNASGKYASDGATVIGKVFNFTGSNAQSTNPLPPASGKGPNYTLKKADFPLRKYHERDTADSDAFPPQNDRNAAVEFESDDVISSQGVFFSKYNSLGEGGKKEKCKTRFPTTGPDVPLFNVKGISVRQVEPRNAPTTINSVFNFRNFWDGRANNVFNGIDPFGLHRPFPLPPDPDPSISRPSEIQVWDSSTYSYTQTRVAIFNSSLASQAVGPALSDFEMSCGGKTFPELGKKLLALQPLRQQKVRSDDSALGP
jgi:cytochrome c peroxidase